MLRANLIEYAKIVMEEVPAPTPGPGQVRLKIETCGVCGTDIHAYHGKHTSIFFPIQPGHEFTGRIDMIGEGVTGWQIGQRVTAEPSMVCGECEYCQRGDYNICYNLKVIGCQLDGAFAEYLNVPAKKLVPLPDNMTFEEGSFIEPLAVGVHAMHRRPVGPDTRLLILGSGTIGLMNLLAARAQGVTEITITDIADSKLEMAMELGAKHAVNVRNTPLPEFCKKTYGTEFAFDIAAECVGTSQTIRDGLPVLKKGGVLIVVGCFSADVPINLNWFHEKEIEMAGSLMYKMEDVIEARDMIVSGRAPISQLISARYPLDKLDEAMKAIDANPERNFKTMIHIQPQ